MQSFCLSVLQDAFFFPPLLQSSASNEHLVKLAVLGGGGMG